MTQYAAMHIEELEHGRPTDVTLGDTDVLLVRQGDQVYALAAKCPHRGVPLSKGIVIDGPNGGQIVCGIHRAAFELSTGEVTRPPACENLARYDVELRDGRVHVTIKDGVEEHPLPPTVKPEDGGEHYVVVGAGAAGWRAAETLRRPKPHGAGFTGRVTVVTDEGPLPYDRTELSKGYLGADEPGSVAIRDQRQVDAQGIAVKQGVVTGLDVDGRKLAFEEGEALDWDRILIATGSDARRLNVPGADLGGIHVIRTLEDAKAMRADLADALADTRDKGRKLEAVIVGGGFIGLEAASAMAGKDEVRLTCVTTDDLPFGDLFGEDFAKRLKGEHEDAGVTFVTGKTTAFTGSDRVEGVKLENGDTIEATLVVMAVGAVPRTDWLPFDRDDDGGVSVNEDFSVPGTEGVFLAGDIARVPTNFGRVRIEHWRFAQETGEVAARNMAAPAGERTGYDGTPFFWSMQQIPGSYTVTGHAEGWDRIDGDVSATDFKADFVKDGEVRQVLAHGVDDEVTAVEPRMRGKGPLKAA